MANVAQEMTMEKWQQLSEQEKKLLLKKLFLDVLFHQTNLPKFMTERDWSDLMEGTTIKVISFQESSSFMVALNLEKVANNLCVQISNKFTRLCAYLKGHVANVQVDGFNLFHFCLKEFTSMYFNFNMEAVYAWLSQPQNRLV